MKTYQHFAKVLLTLLGDSHAVRIINEPFMPLCVEDIGPNGDRNRQISICHYGKQNGDPMRDPEMIFSLTIWDDGSTFAEPTYFRNDYVGLEQEVYICDENGKRTHVRTSLKRELKSFARTWFKNIKDQGFLKSDVTREVIS